MKLFDGLCETVIRALGLSGLTSWDNDRSSAWDRIGPHGIQPQTTFRKDVPAAPFRQDGGPAAFRQDLPGPTRYHSSLETLFPSKKVQAFDGDNVPYGERESEIFLQNERLPIGSANKPENDDSGDPEKEKDLPPGPVFAPPNASPGFVCDYSSMRGWYHSAGVGSRNNWLSKPIMDTDKTGGTYDIFTNYDQYSPIGIVRQYHLNVTDQNINADGINRPDGGKVFNGQYPGPWIEACWGDWVEVTVENHLRYNGTAIHWHGVRMLNAFEHDGVNAITQCAIAPGDSYTYRYRVTQYGTSWYHSHYSLQYADGLAGPITFHGPTSADFDVAVEPFLFGDWSHNSAFQDYTHELHMPPPAKMKTTILNGRGFYNCTNNPNEDCKNKISAPPDKFERVFERGRRYLLRLINTSTASTYIFSIDKHMLQVVAADFVAIEPYYRSSILVGIGQRYHVVVDAIPSNTLIPTEKQNYWIRITGTEGCFEMEEGQGDDRLGIIRYNEGVKELPTSTAYEFDKACADEPYKSLVPVVPVNVGDPVNNIDQETGDNFEVGLEWPSADHEVAHGNFSRWDMTTTPMWLNLTDPLIDHLGDASYNPDDYCLVTEDYEREDWVYLIMGVHGLPGEEEEKKRMFLPLAHPMHLHGHDFALIAQEGRPFHADDVWNGTFNYKNPPRRDTALMPTNGYMAMAFRTDNPGLWILHCHIAWHASSGLGINIRENEHLIKMSQHAEDEKNRVCKNWRAWFGEAEKHWWDEHEFQEDSGI